MRNKSRIFLLSSLTYACAVLLFIANGQAVVVKADTNHVVISQIQLSGTTASDEFVELYNPTNSAIDLAKWRLTRRAAGGTSPQNLVASLSGSIAPKSYHLITHPSATANSLADTVYSSSSSGMTTNNIITLYSDAGTTIVDLVGLSTATIFETSPYPDNPEGGESIVRKATANSTSQSLFTGGIEATLGNGLDTDNNNTDFVLFTTSLPRNSSVTTTQPTITPVITTSPAPTAITPSPSFIVTPTLPQPSLTPTVVPTIVVTSVPTVTPTVSPTNAPTPTNIPTLTKTPTPTVSPTAAVTTAPTLSPTSTPVLTNTPSPTATIVPTATNTPVPSAIPTTIPTPTITPTPTPRSGVIIDKPLYANRRLVCTQTYKTIKIMNMQFYIPKISCSIVRS